MNTIPGDEDPLNPSGIRLGTPELTRIGMKESDMEVVADFYERALLKSARATVMILSRSAFCFFLLNI